MLGFYVFRGDSQVVKVDFELPVRYVVDKDIVIVGVVVALEHDGVLRRH